MRTHLRDQLKEIDEGVDEEIKRRNEIVRKQLAKKQKLQDDALELRKGPSPTLHGMVTKSLDKTSNFLDKHISEPLTNKFKRFKNSVVDAKRTHEIRREKGTQETEYQKEKKKLEQPVLVPTPEKPVEKPSTPEKPKSPENKGGFTQAHAIGGAMLATALGLGAHKLYKKYKRGKKRDKLKQRINFFKEN